MFTRSVRIFSSFKKNFDDVNISFSYRTNQAWSSVDLRMAVL